MTDTLPDLRPLLADLLDDYARHGPLNWIEPLADRIHRGAQTLRWCAEREAPTVVELQAEVGRLADELEETRENRDDLVANVRYAVREWEHHEMCPKGQALADGHAVCACELSEHRASILAAIA